MMFCSASKNAYKARDAARVMLVLKYGSINAAYDHWISNRDCISWKVDTWSYYEADAMVMHHASIQGASR